MTRPKKGDPQFGPICQCGQPKAKQARTCQSCHGVIRGYGRQARVDRLAGVPAAPWDRENALRAAALTVDGELADLVAEQMRDDRVRSIGHRGCLSLDAPLVDGLTLYEVIAA